MQQRIRGSVAESISNAMVQSLRTATGRGPSHARTMIDRDLVVVVLDEVLTKQERRLTESGETEHVMHGRGLLQEAMREDLVSIIERETGRKVRAFLGANGAEPDISAEIFLLETDADSGKTKGPP